MSRSIWKGPFIPHISIKANNEPLIISERAGTITPDLLNLNVKVHNGLSFSKPITITTSHIGFKFGSLIKTKKNGSFKNSAKSKNKR